MLDTQPLVGDPVAQALERRLHDALDGDGPRSVRAAVGASVVLLLWALAHLISGVAPATPRR